MVLLESRGLLLSLSEDGAVLDWDREERRGEKSGGTFTFAREISFRRDMVFLADTFEPGSCLTVVALDLRLVNQNIPSSLHLLPFPALTNNLI